MDLSNLREPFRTQVQNGLELLLAQKVPHAITSVTRSQVTQFVLWMQGRTPHTLQIIYREHLGMKPLTEIEMETIVTQTDGVVLVSNHQKGLAIDIVPANTSGVPFWPPFLDPAWKVISDIMKSCGCVWGGDWLDFPDMPHYEMKGADAVIL